MSIQHHENQPAHFSDTHVKRLDEAGLSETAIQQRIGHVKGSKITRIHTHSDEVIRKDTINIYLEYKKGKKSDFNSEGFCEGQPKN
ncbi:hypothetical protein HB912_10350 [Listeria aquatica]|uniref:Tyr recombinase domain-containing protein n=1 Tax=Listeria aquatica TaxID=1494960 RepID=A0A841ZSC4_9LIST|nr:hypothetical protein [Listeria aquatica]MBC1522045.1 hypothetical protein [Listeria aquatica]